MESLRISKREPARFSTIIDFIGTPESDRWVGLKASLMTFINTLVNSSEEVADRQEMRGDFLALDTIR
jgi:hypothetical protein